MALEFIGDLIGYGEMQVDDAVATMEGLQVELSVENSRMVVNESEAMVVINIRFPMPATAVV